MKYNLLPASPRKLSLWLTLLLMTLAVVFATRMASAEPRIPPESTPHELLVARVYYEEVADIDQLAGYDVWEYNNLEEKYVLVSGDSATLQKIQADGWRVEVDEEASAQLDLPAIPGNTATTFYGGYRRVSGLHTDLYDANANHPTLTEIFKYGDSYCQIQAGCTTLGGDFHGGYDLLAIRVTNEEIAGSSTISGTTIVSGTKPVFFLMANIHSREITTPEVAMRMLDWLLDGYGTDPDATWLVDWHEIWIIPTANPDGHWIVELGTDFPYSGAPFTQRKNANNETECNFWEPSAAAQYGIDLNRNSSYGWGGSGTSTDPCSLVFRGLEAASEPEVAQLQAFVSNIIPDQRGPNVNDVAPPDTKGLFITMHSFSELVLWPWGNTTAPAPNYDGLKAIGDKLATYNGYLSCQPSLCLYSASGTTDDWSYGELGVPSFTYELGNQFMPPYPQVDAEQWPDNGPSLQYAAKIAYAPYKEAHGPDVLDITAVPDGNRLQIDATVNDSLNGNDDIVAAMVTFDQPHWVSGTVTHSLTIADGNGNTAIEDITGAINMTGLSNGQHTAFIYGQDAEGNWGPASAVFFDVNFGLASTTTGIGPSSAYIYPGETYSYTIFHEMELDGLHDYNLALSNILPPEVTFHPDTVTVNGAPATVDYDSDSHTFTYSADGQFTDSIRYDMTFQVTAADDLVEAELVNIIQSNGDIDGLAFPAQDLAPSTKAGMSTATITRDIMVDKTEAGAGETVTFNLTQQIEREGTHPFTLQLTNPLSTNLTILVDTITVNGVDSPDAYDEDTHSLYIPASGTFTNSTTIDVSFSATINGDAMNGESISNHFTSQGFVDGYAYAEASSDTAVILIQNRYNLFLPTLFK